MKKTITIRSFAKVNLSLDVGAPRADGMHPVDTVMQLIGIGDDVKVSVCARSEAEDKAEDPASRIFVTTDLTALQAGGHVTEDLPADRGNIAHRAAERMMEHFREAAGRKAAPVIHIAITKRIPIAAGLAGGSGNAAAVLHALNVLWSLDLSLTEIMKIAAELGSDVPFCAAGMVAGNREVLPARLVRDPLASPCGRGRGTGTEVEPLPAWDSAVVIAKPDIGMSTAAVYRGFDRCIVSKRPDNDALAQALAAGDRAGVYRQMINVLELYSLVAAPQIQQLKTRMEQEAGADSFVLMSGSGPTVYALLASDEAAARCQAALAAEGWQAYNGRTLTGR